MNHGRETDCTEGVLNQSLGRPDRLTDPPASRRIGATTLAFITSVVKIVQPCSNRLAMFELLLLLYKQPVVNSCMR